MRSDASKRTLIDPLRTLVALDVRPMRVSAIGFNRLLKVCTFCDHEQTMDLLDLHDRPMHEAHVMVLAAELDGAPQVCPRCSGAIKAAHALDVGQGGEQ